VAARSAIVALAVLVIGAGIVVAGGPARGIVVADTTPLLDGIPHEVDPATFPEITADQDALDFDHTLAGAGAQAILVTLAENLEVESQALLRRDLALLAAVDHGDRLTEMEGRLREAETTGRAVIEHYRFDAVNVTLILPFGVQSGASIGFESRGTLTRETVDASGTVVDQVTEPFELTFAVRRATGARWLIVAVLPPGGGG
jgi:hypothetical protein